MQYDNSTLRSHLSASPSRYFRVSLSWVWALLPLLSPILAFLGESDVLIIIANHQTFRTVVQCASTHPSSGSCPFLALIVFSSFVFFFPSPHTALNGAPSQPPRTSFSYATLPLLLTTGNARLENIPCHVTSQLMHESHEAFVTGFPVHLIKATDSNMPSRAPSHPQPHHFVLPMVVEPCTQTRLETLKKKLSPL